MFYTFSGSNNKVEGGSFEVKEIVKEYTTDQNSPTVTTIEGGTFNVNPSAYVTGEGKGVISDGKNTFTAGTDEELSKAAEQMITAGAKAIEVLKGDVNLEIEKNGITVTNKGDGDVIVNGQEVTETPLEVHVPVEVTTGEEFVQAVKDESVEEIIVMNSIEVKEVLNNISRDLKIEGRDGAVVKFTNGKMIFSYKDGVDVEIKNLTFEGKDIAGLIQWNSANEYKENANPAEMPTFHVENCVFTNSTKEGAGIGFWNDNRRTAQPSASKVTVTKCEFDNIGVGLYFSEEGPLPNLQAEISSNIFRDYNWGILGGPSNAYIHDNLFDDTGEYAVQFLLNVSAPKTGTRIVNNAIESKNGIQIMPYHLNENNALKEGAAETVTVTKDMLPTIKENTRDADEYLVTFVAYRDGTSEYAELKAGALDISENYTAGKQPQIRLVTQKVADGKDVIDKVTEENGLMPEINNETYYQDSIDVGNPDKLVNATDIKAAEKVDELIDAIGPADKVTLDSRDAILAAKEAYAALTDKQKKLVTGYADLLQAIEDYNALLNTKPETKPDPEPDKDKPIDKPDNETTKKPSSAKTGDTANVAGYMTIMVLAAGAVIVALRKKYKTN